MTTARHRRLARLESRIDPEPVTVELTILDGVSGAVVTRNTFNLSPGWRDPMPTDFSLQLDHPDEDVVHDPPAQAGTPRRSTR